MAAINGLRGQPIQAPIPILEERTLIQRICDFATQTLALLVSCLFFCCRPIQPERVQQQQPEVQQFNFPRGFRFLGQIRLLNGGQVQPDGIYQGSGNYRHLYGAEAMETISRRALDNIVFAAPRVDLSVEGYGEHFIDSLLLSGAQTFYHPEIPHQYEHQQLDPINGHNYQDTVQALVEQSQGEATHCIGAILRKGGNFYTLFIDPQNQRFYCFNPQGDALRICNTVDSFANHINDGAPFILAPCRLIPRRGMQGHQ